MQALRLDLHTKIILQLQYFLTIITFLGYLRAIQNIGEHVAEHNIVIQNV